jgi:hypothetical protein
MKRYNLENKMIRENKSNPVRTLSVPGSWGSEISRQQAHECGKVVSLMHRPPLLPIKYSWCSFLLEAESTPGPQCGQKDYVNENSIDTIGNRTRDLQTCSAVPQPTTPPHAPEIKLKEI